VIDETRFSANMCCITHGLCDLRDTRTDCPADGGSRCANAVWPSFANCANSASSSHLFASAKHSPNCADSLPFYTGYVWKCADDLSVMNMRMLLYGSLFFGIYIGLKYVVAPFIVGQGYVIALLVLASIIGIAHWVDARKRRP
jgi:hypothetical protein